MEPKIKIKILLFDFKYSKLKKIIYKKWGMRQRYRYKNPHILLLRWHQYKEFWFE